MAGTSAPSSRSESRGYRPNEVLVAEIDARRVAAKLSTMNLGNVEMSDQPDLLGIVRVSWEAPRDAGDVVDEVRRDASGHLQGTPAISPNHIFAPDVDPVTTRRMDPLLGQPVDMGGPAQPPMETRKRLRPRTASDRPGTGVTVGVIDTGATAHEWLAGSFLATPDDFDPVDTDDNGELDVQAGHGTFVAGIILQHAPGATVRIERVLDHHGEAEVQSVANAIVSLGRTGVDIINLSLGGYSRGNNEPKPIRDALAALRPDVVVVAAAGNHDPEKHRGLKATRKFWPAASPSVVAVAALNPVRGNSKPKRAPFSNFGEWVDVSAVGVGQVSTFLTFNDKRGSKFDGFATWSGTSFAAPAVAGAIAARMTDLNGDRVRSAQQAKKDLLEREADGEPASLAGISDIKDAPVGRYLLLKSPFH
jgi:subtilisin family serine protease